MASNRYLTDAESGRASSSREKRVAAAQAVVYDDNEERIAAEELATVLEEYGVDIGGSEDGLPEYRDVPRELSLSVCHTAVDLRDPVKFIAPRA